jgi:outer membrane receptor protein involved in Fe transport
MNRILLFTIALFSVLPVRAQTKTKVLSGIIIDATKKPVEGASIYQASGPSTITDERGRFMLVPDKQDTLVYVSSIGHEPVVISVQQCRKGQGIIMLAAHAPVLNDIQITSGGYHPFQAISRLDLKVRGISNAPDVLRLVPGLFIGQHAGGGKAEQIFLRGYDLDHGTDISIGVDGIPVNMVSHAHGQGYADLHFLIPELIESVNFLKGSYDASKGNFNTAGAVDFKTLDYVRRNQVKIEGGMFRNSRVVALVNLLGEKQEDKDQSAYIASEYRYNRGYFDHPQGFQRFNIFSRYKTRLSPHTNLSLSASHFWSKWNASGQIPERAIKSGMIGFFGAIDPNEGGHTSRSNLNLQLITQLKQGSYVKNQFYYTRNHFKLYSDFTFFKEDPVNGDQIRQAENRSTFGYNGSYHRSGFAGKFTVNTDAGISIRADRTAGSELSRTKDRSILILPVMLGDISETNMGAYVQESIRFSKKITLKGGLRYDVFFNRYKDRLRGDSIDGTSASVFSPKLSLQYNSTSQVQFYVSFGKGFHSNDTRVVVPRNGLQTLPPVHAVDLGTVFKPAKNIMINAALWYLLSEQEFIYVGDEGIVEANGKSRRYGMDVSLRYQPLRMLYLDMDLNYAHGRSADAPRGENFLPLAPVFNSTGGLVLKAPSGINGGIRYRYLGNRPANETYSLTAKGYFITDLHAGYTRDRYEASFTVENLFNKRWKEAQFETESRLPGEPDPVTEIHFTPGTPLFAKAALTLFF